MRSAHESNLLRFAAFALCLSLPVQLWAGALYVYEMGSPADVATAGAGMAAKAQNASTVFTNPAGMTRFDQPELLVSGVGMNLHGPFKPGAVRRLMAVTDRPMSCSVAAASSMSTRDLPIESGSYSAEQFWSGAGLVLEMGGPLSIRQ